MRSMNRTVRRPVFVPGSRKFFAFGSIVLSLSLLPACLAAQSPAQAGREPSRPLQKELDAIFNRHEYAAKSVKFAWQKGGEIYTILEPDAKAKGTEIVGYDSASGKRTVLVSAAQLTPSGDAGKAAGPLAIDAYSW